MVRIANDCNQPEFSGGLRSAFPAWRKQCAGASHENGDTLPFATNLEEFLKPFRVLALPSPNAAEAAPTRQKGRS